MDLPVGNTDIILLIAGLLLVTLFLYASLISVRENETFAAGRYLLIAFIIAIVYIILPLFAFESNLVIHIILFSFPVLIILISFLPIRFRKNFSFSLPQNRIDERDTMFSRNELNKGNSNFEEYYRKNTEKLAIDDNFRSNPGLLNPRASNYSPFTFKAAEASFNAIDALKNKVDGNVSPDKIEAKPPEITRFIKNWALKLGALDIGITFLKDYHKYTHRGRKGNYGLPVDNGHRFAIAITVEMDFNQVRSGPLSPIVMESAQQYMSSGAIAVQLAEFIRRSGYRARAHIDGNYEVVCPLVARDAGLGEIGRMGLLMTPKQGPRVRIAVVTTDIPLLVDKPKNMSSVIEFCTYCKKCAANCPSSSISFDPREQINGT